MIEGKFDHVPVNLGSCNGGCFYPTLNSTCKLFCYYKDWSSDEIT